MNDDFRGYLVEIIISKLLYATSVHTNMQLVAMSATLPNMEQVRTCVCRDCIVNTIPYHTLTGGQLDERILSHLQLPSRGVDRGDPCG